jgi:dihydroxy-acid dehydratase
MGSDVWPEGAEGRSIPLIQDGDPIIIDIPNRATRLAVSDQRGAPSRRNARPWQPSVAARRAQSAGCPPHFELTLPSSQAPPCGRSGHWSMTMPLAE